MLIIREWTQEVGCTERCAQRIYSWGVAAVIVACRERNGQPAGGDAKVQWEWGNLSISTHTHTHTRALPTVRLPHSLRCANITIIDHKECENDYPGNITDTMVCASVREEGKDSCQVCAPTPCLPSPRPQARHLALVAPNPPKSISQSPFLFVFFEGATHGDAQG